MPFYALSYHIGVRKGMEGHQDILKGNLRGKGMPFFLKVFGRAWPSFFLTISFWGSKGHGRASSCDVQKVILILWKGLVAFWEGIFFEDAKNDILGGQFGICYQCILKWIW